MTREEAQAEAERRWGPCGYAVVAGKSFTGMDEHVVGLDTFMDAPPTIKGRGDSWESAFRDADRRAGEGKGQ